MNVFKRLWLKYKQWDLRQMEKSMDEMGLDIAKQKTRIVELSAE